MTEDTGLSVPVVLIIFNRPDLTARSFTAIRRARPRQLFIVADGPRTLADEERCEEARAIVRQVDWDCEWKADFSERNLGCGLRPVTGLDWVFSQVEQAIILEDDCLATPSFFKFCENLLEKYRDNERVMHIAGSNFLASSEIALYSYHFSKYAHVWGWATWARAWRQMDLEMKQWEAFVKDGSKSVLPDPVERKHWIHKLRPIAAGERGDVWDYQWQFAVWARRGLCIVPGTNLITNTGFREDGTHTRAESEQANLPTGEMPEELSYPPLMRIDEDADRRTFYKVLEGKRLLERRTWRYRISKPVRIYRKLVNGYRPRLRELIRESASTKESPAELGQETLAFQARRVR